MKPVLKQSSSKKLQSKNPFFKHNNLKTDSGLIDSSECNENHDIVPKSIQKGFKAAIYNIKEEVNYSQYQIENSIKMNSQKKINNQENITEKLSMVQIMNNIKKLKSNNQSDSLDNLSMSNQCLKNSLSKKLNCLKGSSFVNHKDKFRGHVRSNTIFTNENLAKSLKKLNFDKSRDFKTDRLHKNLISHENNQSIIESYEKEPSEIFPNIYEKSRKPRRLNKLKIYKKIIDANGSLLLKPDLDQNEVSKLKEIYIKWKERSHKINTENQICNDKNLSEELSNKKRKLNTLKVFNNLNDFSTSAEREHKNLKDFFCVNKLFLPSKVNSKQKGPGFYSEKNQIAPSNKNSTKNSRNILNDLKTSYDSTEINQLSEKNDEDLQNSSRKMNSLSLESRSVRKGIVRELKDKKTLWRDKITTLKNNYIKNSSGLKIAKFEKNAIGNDRRDFESPSSLLKHDPKSSNSRDWSCNSQVKGGGFFDSTLRSVHFTSAIKEFDYNIVKNKSVAPEWLDFKDTNQQPKARPVKPEFRLQSNRNDLSVSNLNNISSSINHIRLPRFLPRNNTEKNLNISPTNRIIKEGTNCPKLRKKKGLLKNILNPCLFANKSPKETPVYEPNEISDRNYNKLPNNSSFDIQHDFGKIRRYKEKSQSIHIKDYKKYVIETSNEMKESSILGLSNINLRKITNKSIDNNSTIKHIDNENSQKIPFSLKNEWIYKKPNNSGFFA